MKNNSLIKKVLERLRDNRKLEMTVYIVMILSAVIIFLITGGISCDRKAETATDLKPSEPQESNLDFERGLEARLEKVLSEIEGAGKVTVMITTESRYSEYGDQRERETEENASGNVKSRVIKGVIIVAEGAENLKVKTDLIEAVKTVLSVEPSIINVFH